jgi:hypothetical protein
MRYFKFGLPLIVGLFWTAGFAMAQTAPSDFAASARARVNYYRAMAKLPPIIEDSAIVAGAVNHARYLVKNGIAGGDIVLDKSRIRVATPQDAFRWEEESQPFYTSTGASAGRDALVLTAQEITISGAEFVDRLMTMPFNGLYPMVPQFSVAGLGEYCEPGDCAIVIPYRFALEKSVRIALYDGPASDRLWNPSLGLIPMEVGRLRSPVEFPPEGATVSQTTYDGDDYPDPLSACADYKAPTGAPISIQLGQGFGPDGSLDVSSSLVTRDGSQIETCLITASTYVGRDNLQTEAGKRVLQRLGAAVILPREPLAAGRYKVALTEDGKPYEWSFTVATPAATPQSATREPDKPFTF